MSEKLGIQTRIFEYVVDYDASSMYPSIIRMLHTIRNAIYGRIMFVVDKVSGEHIMSGDLFGTLMQSIGVSTFYLAKKAYKAPRMDELIQEFEEKLKE